MIEQHNTVDPFNMHGQIGVILQIVFRAHFKYGLTFDIGVHRYSDVNMIGDVVVRMWSIKHTYTFPGVIPAILGDHIEIERNESKMIFWPIK